ncbi:hypothetical protein [Gemmiger sp.]|uniref:hypothetical protein n=1 Tax=Gemmiger sp. TaxID=2049027 RepID=UPI002A91C45B|nr:hypothetical protein [Gemmiger sp.]
MAHRAAHCRRLQKFGSFATKTGEFWAGNQLFPILTTWFIQPVMWITFPPAVENAPPILWKTWLLCGFSTFSTEFSTRGKWVFHYGLYKQRFIAHPAKGLWIFGAWLRRQL